MTVICLNAYHTLLYSRRIYFQAIETSATLCQQLVIVYESFKPIPFLIMNWVLLTIAMSSAFKAIIKPREKSRTGHVPISKIIKYHDILNFVSKVFTAVLDVKYELCHFERSDSKL